MCAHHVLRSNIETGRGLSNFGHPCMFALILEHCGLVIERGEGGGELISPKIEFLQFCARIVFWRTPVFRDNFWSHTKLLAKTDFSECSLFALKTH